MRRKTLRAADLAVALGLAALFVVLPFSGGSGQPRHLEVTLADKSFVEPLSTGEELSLPGPLGRTHVEISEGRVRVVESPCPNKLCIRMGWIERSGQAIVCLPNKVALTLGGEDREGVDAVSR